jgi:hypothetical protein
MMLKPHDRAVEAFDSFIEFVRVDRDQRISESWSVLPCSHRSDPGVVRISPDSSSVLIPERTIGQPP